MVNTLEIYRDTGRKAARAVNHGDMALQRFLVQHLTAMIALEALPDRVTAVEAYDAAYQQARNIRRR